jgi:restriction system protein
MNNPGFQEYFIPVLQQLNSGTFLERRKLIDAVSQFINLTPEVMAERLPTQSQPTYVSRIGWALTYLRKSGLVVSPSRGMWQITKEGKELLSSPPNVLNISYLKKNYPNFRTFHETNVKTQHEIMPIQDELTPEETFLQSYEEIKRNVCDDLLDRVISNSPDFFEHLVIDLMLKMGYGSDQTKAGIKLGRSGDEGIDGIINQDKLGLDIIYIQAKRWKRGNNVGRPALMEFDGALSMKKASKGVFITTSDFTLEAKNYIQKIEKKMILISGTQLVDYMFEYGVGVTKGKSYELKKIDSDYFEE